MLFLSHYLIKCDSCFCMDKKKNVTEVNPSRSFGVGLSGFEPELRRPKCLVLPLHHSPILSNPFWIAGAKIQKKNEAERNIRKIFSSSTYFLLFLPFASYFQQFCLLRYQKEVLLLSLLYKKVFPVKKVILSDHLVKRGQFLFV